MQPVQLFDILNDGTRRHKLSTSSSPQPQTEINIYDICAPFLFELVAPRLCFHVWMQKERRDFVRKQVMPSGLENAEELVIE